MLTRKTVLLGVCGGIAAFKIAGLASALRKLHCNVHVIMTEHATNFITPITFEELTGNRCITQTFDRNFVHNVQHVALAKQADLCLIAPATANVIAKMAHGIADDMLTTTVLACNCPKLVAPAMNTAMLDNPVTQRNLRLLQEDGFTVVPPACGYLACGDTGRGKLPEPEILLQYIQQAIAKPKDMRGLKVLVTAGPTREALDPVRYLTNHSSGRMGYALANMAACRGAEVTLVTGPTQLPPPLFAKVVPVVSAKEMFEAVTAHVAQQDVVVMAAAVADYSPAEYSPQKRKKSALNMTIPLAPTQDILAYLGANRRPGQFLCGFSMETHEVVRYAREKLLKKQVDMMVANDVTQPGAGFALPTNAVTIITKTEEVSLPLQSKEEVACEIFDRILQMRAH